MPIHKVYLSEETFGLGRAPPRQKRPKLIHTAQVETEQREEEGEAKEGEYWTASTSFMLPKKNKTTYYMWLVVVCRDPLTAVLC